MTDRELLEAAAKAANQERSAGGDLWSNVRGVLWNPLLDDGDALRLAVNLDMYIVVRARLKEVSACADGGVDCEEKFDGDQYAATRRAIVRAAAAMSETKK